MRVAQAEIFIEIDDFCLASYDDFSDDVVFDLTIMSA
jgi:hypothetical protein